MITLKKIFAFDPSTAETELIKNRRELISISRRDENHEIDVLGESRGTVKGERVSIHEQELNFPREAQCDELSDVLVKYHGLRDRKWHRV